MSENRAFCSQQINAAAKAAKADPERIPDFIAAIYPFLQWRARWVRTEGSLHDAEDLAVEAIPGMLKQLRYWNEEYDFMGIAWLRAKQIMGVIARRHGRSMRNPCEADAKYRPTGFVPLDAPLYDDSGATLGDNLTYEPGEPDHGPLAAIPLHLLPEEERAILTAYYVEGKNWAAIAKAHRSTRQNIHQRAAKAIQRLRKLYDEQRALVLAESTKP